MGVIEPDGSAAFASFVRGRRVAVAGPARTRIARHDGPLIDSFDLVVRFNELLLHLGTEAAPAADFGRRADVVYANQVVLRTRGLADRHARRAFIASIRALNVRYVVCTNNSMSFGADGVAAPHCPPADRRVLTDLARMLDDEGTGARVRVLSVVSNLAHRWLGGQWGRTGFLAVLDLLLADAARTYVTGMTLYHDGGHVLSDERSVLHPLKNRDGSWAQSPSGEGHDSYRERDITRCLARFYRRTLSVDEDLLKILGYTTGPEPWPAESHTSSASSTAERS
jgi:hypothetical protein